MAAFDNGLALGADGLELDVHLSRDGVVVVHHDRMLDRTTTLRGPDRRAQRRTSCGRAARADAGRRARALPRRADHRRAEGQPRRSSPRRRSTSIRRAGRGRSRLPRLVRAGACCAPRARSSRRSRRAPRAKRCGGRSTVRGAAGRCRASPTAATGAGVAGRTRVVSPRFVDYAHRAGLGVQVWTVDTEDDARRLLGWGVDALITDRRISSCRCRCVASSAAATSNSSRG